MKPVIALIDFSDATLAVLNAAGEQARLGRQPLILIHVEAPVNPAVTYSVPGHETPVPDAEHLATLRSRQAERLRAIHRDLELKAAAWSSAEVPGRVLVLEDNDVAAALLREAQELNAGLLVLGSHHHHQFYHRFVGSVTDKVVWKASCPILIIPLT
ncbi:MAG: hypothetical protein RL095_3800 [Verrucomicrobiota bacterium]|jgi:nucleotide-binding universal stress UspA family protein